MKLTFEFPSPEIFAGYSTLVHRAMRGARAECRVTSSKAVQILSKAIDLSIPDLKTVRIDYILTYLYTIQKCLIDARYQTNSEQATDLIDAIHNIPGLLMDYPNLNYDFIYEDLYRYETDYLGGLRKYTNFLEGFVAE